MPPDHDTPTWTLTAAQRDLVERVLAGLRPPPAGGPDGVAFAVDATTARRAERAGRLELRDLEGTIVAELGVHRAGDHDVVGEVHPRAGRTTVAFAHLHLDAATVRSRACERPTTVVQPVAPPGVGTLDAWLTAAGADHLVVQPVLRREPEDRWATQVRGFVRSLAAAPDVTLQLAPLPLGPEGADDRLAAAVAVGARRVIDPDPGVAARLRASRDLEVVPSGAPDDDVMAPSVAADELAARSPGAGAGLVVLFTGLSGSGKSTLARHLRCRLLERGGRTTTLLDGDVVRRALSRGLGFSREDREVNVRRIGWVAAEVARHGGVAVCAPIAPEDRVRRAVRADVSAAGGRFVLVHVATPLEVCEARDVKGLYARARAGALTGFTGIDDPYEVPTDAEVVVDTSTERLDDAVDRVLVAAGLSDETRR